MPWWALFLILVVVNVAGRLIAPTTVGRLLPSMLAKAWGVYLALWIRSVNPRSYSIFWTTGTFLSDAVLSGLELVPDQSAIVSLGILLWIVLAIGTGITAIYVVRHELQEHYRRVEPVGLDLGPVLTFFFSYIYFQYHLHDIAEAKRLQSSALHG
jgi:hypothetical protein